MRTFTALALATLDQTNAIVVDSTLTSLDSSILGTTDTCRLYSGMPQFSDWSKEIWLSNYEYTVDGTPIEKAEFSD